MVLKGCYLRKGKTEQKPAQTELVQLVQSPVSDTAKSTGGPVSSLELTHTLEKPVPVTVTFLPML